MLDISEVAFVVLSANFLTSSATTAEHSPDIHPVMHAKELLELQNLVRRVPVADLVVDYAVDLVRKSRPREENSPQFVKDWVSWGAGPRASQFLVLGAKARCILDGRPTPEIEDIKTVAKEVLRHRIITNFNAEAENISSLEIIDKLMEEN